MTPPRPRVTLDDGAEATVEERGRCLFCGKKALLLKEPGRWSAGHEQPTCEAFRRAIDEKRACIVPEGSVQ